MILLFEIRIQIPLQAKLLRFIISENFQKEEERLLLFKNDMRIQDTNGSLILENYILDPLTISECVPS